MVDEDSHHQRICLTQGQQPISQRKVCSMSFNINSTLKPLRHSTCLAVRGVSAMNLHQEEQPILPSLKRIQPWQNSSRKHLQHLELKTSNLLGWMCSSSF